MAAGAGEYVIGVVAAAVILVSLWPINAIADRLHGTSHARVAAPALDAARRPARPACPRCSSGYKIEIGQIATQRLAKDNYQADVTVRGRNAATIAQAIEDISRIPDVEIVSTTQAD